jgi:hypothetical protein
MTCPSLAVAHVNHVRGDTCSPMQCALAHIIGSTSSNLEEVAYANPATFGFLVSFYLEVRRDPENNRYTLDTVMLSCTASLCLLTWRIPEGCWVFSLALNTVGILLRNWLPYTHAYTFTEPSSIQRPTMGLWLQFHLFIARLALARFVSMYPDRILRKYREVLLWLVLLASYLLPQNLVLLGVFEFLAYLRLVGNLHSKAHKRSQTDNC